MAQVPCSSGGSTSGNWAGSLGPGKCTKGTRGKHRREHVTIIPDAGEGLAQQEVGSLVLQPTAAHHPQPRPLLGNTIRHPLGWREQGGRGNLCPWEAPPSPQGSPVRPAGTHAPSAGRTRTRACGERPPGREKELSRWPREPVGRLASGRLSPLGTRSKPTRGLGCLPTSPHHTRPPTLTGSRPVRGKPHRAQAPHSTDPSSRLPRIP